jgi:DNA adenine methylase
VGTVSILKRPLFSPLRYPGGKSALFPLLCETVRLNGAGGGTYVEPYAGGGGVALGLLLTEQVERVVVNDLDPAIYAFWTAVTMNSEKFLKRLQSVELSVSEWNRQHEIYRRADSDDIFELGFATFYLNPTNRSGVMNGGVIGGQQQTGNYKIDARFNRKSLSERCRLIALYASRIVVLNHDGVDVIEQYSRAPKSLIYADPPYYEKGSQLYLNAFDDEAHGRLALTLNEITTTPWVLTYDPRPEIKALYAERRQFTIDVGYSVRSARRESELLIASDSTRLPMPYI